MGKLKRNNQSYEEAIEYFNKSIKIDKNNFDAYLGMAFAMNSMERYDEELDYYNRALEIDPTNELALSWKAVCLHHYLKRYEEAIATYDKIINKNPEGNTNSMGDVGGIYLLYLNQSKTAKWYFDRQFSYVNKIRFNEKYFGKRKISDVFHYDIILKSKNTFLDNFYRNYPG